MRLALKYYEQEAGISRRLSPILRLEDGDVSQPCRERLRRMYQVVFTQTVKPTPCEDQVEYRYVASDHLNISLDFPCIV